MDKSLKIKCQQRNFTLFPFSFSVIQIHIMVANEQPKLKLKWAHIIITTNEFKLKVRGKKNETKIENDPFEEFKN